MSITIKSENKDGYLHISCQGIYAIDNFIEIFKKAILLTEESDYKYLLLLTVPQANTCSIKNGWL